MASDINPAVRQAIGRLARAAIEAEITGTAAARHRVDELRSAIDFAAPYGGTFVSLYVAGKLRGCIGRFDGSRPLADTLVVVARQALQDPRFANARWQAAELDELAIEVSILSPLVVIHDAKCLVAGVHGVVISRGDQTGCLLPQVATHRGWSMTTFLTFCCQEKAGMDPEAWQDPDTTVRAFEATVIRDEPRGGPARPGGASDRDGVGGVDDRRRDSG